MSRWAPDRLRPEYLKGPSFGFSTGDQPRAVPHPGFQEGVARPKKQEDQKAPQPHGHMQCPL